MKQLTDIELAYFAGFVDGDGCFLITLSNQPNGKSFRVRLVVTNTNPEVMRWIVKRFGGKFSKRLKLKASYKQKYVWLTYSERSIELAKMLYPFLIVKKRQAEVMMRWPAKTVSNPTYRIKLLKEMQKLNNWKGMKGKAGVQLQRLNIKDNRKVVCNSLDCKDDKLAESAEMPLRLAI